MHACEIGGHIQISRCNRKSIAGVACGSIAESACGCKMPAESACPEAFRYTTALRCGLSFSSMSFGLSKDLEKRLTIDVRLPQRSSLTNLLLRPSRSFYLVIPEPSSTPDQYKRL